ncbi:MCE family protein [Mycolicibacterium thermoresistibile]|jgi:virulence factor Mce-like protein|uniref:Virulence factor n=2 Tax=Mycolicibacterium thermoresistibile TaxID=1797 RepID=G7CJS6_MYCT3|nr:MCE family protein [Mycolicibacterium thermoresistibile]EHI12794.1 virulence factor [Mycolicibacterium thermoresistibile ATCC 19527]MCV7189949.1 MCE family protein [Mycolicibacterium thermoresistibile]GAT13998.1 virulence factor Mce family protein [Mycolicibacterium thermoresistibile]SNW19170.1 Virulence factor Mce family protein [Mycolicibacterium thermoresistibile]
MSRSYARPLAGLATVVVIGLIIAVAIGLFQGSFRKSVPVTVIAERAGLVMNPDAKVKMRGVQVGQVDRIENRPDGTAVLHLAMDPSQLHLIPKNVIADIASTTVFGAKSVQLTMPPEPSAERLQPGQVLRGDHVMIEINTIFQQLVDVLDHIDPVKLNETLGAIASAFSGRGEQFGQTLTDFEALLARLEPSLPAFSRDLELSAQVSAAYADAAPNLLRTMQNSITLSDGIVDEQDNLDAFLVSAIGLADVGNDVLGGNREAFSEVLELLVPTTNLLNEYAPAINCSLLGMEYVMNQPPLMDPGVLVNVAFTLGIDRYRYPSNLPKVGAKGGPHCMGLPFIGFGNRSKYLVTDVNANPWQYGNQGIVLNSDGLKQLLFGPLDGPPRNTAQIGQPG